MIHRNVLMYNWNAAFTPPDTPSQIKEPSSAAELERLSVVIPNVISTRDFDFKSPEAQELLSRVSSDFVSDLDTQEKGLSWAGQVASWRLRAEEYPDVQFAVTSVWSTVDESKGCAQVYVEMEVSGYGDVKLHAINELRWRRVDGKWLWCYVIGMRGTLGNSGLG